MLLNASHELTNCGLPQQIQERYVRYKQGNRAIVAWLTKYGPDKYKGRKTLPIKQLIALGRILCDKINEIGTLPSDVDYYFKEVIQERTYLSKHFRQFRDQCEEDAIDTINHEHFTESLKQIHKILLTAGRPSTKSKPVVTTLNHKHPRLSTSSGTGVKNGFAQLSIVSVQSQLDSDDSGDDAYSDTDTNDTSECSHSASGDYTCNCENDDNAADFLDMEGKVGVAVETTIFLQNIVRISEAIKACWLKAGRDKTPEAAASAYTNILLGKAVNNVQEFCRVDSEHMNSSNPRQRLAALHQDAAQHLTLIDDGIAGLSRLLCDLHDGYLLQATQIPSEASSNHRSLVEHTAHPATLVSAIASALQVLYKCRTASSITFDGIPFASDLFLSEGRDERSRVALTSSVVIYLMSVSHCAYSSTLAQPSQIAMPRIKALKMANEALGAIRGFVDDKSIFPCQCVNTLAHRVIQMEKELDAFAKHKCWNVVSQSPLVAGNHVLEIQDLCSYYGMHLFHYRQYVAGVLHTYQALTTLNAVEKSMPLEDVCNLFAPFLYTTATRPDSGFLANWLRYIGARLRFKKGRKTQNHKDTWCMSVPAHAAAKSAGLNISYKNEDARIQPKFDYSTIDPVIKLKRTGWILQGEAANQLDDELENEKYGGSEQLKSSCFDQLQQVPPRVKRTQHVRTKSCHIGKNGSEATCHKLEHILAANFTVDVVQSRNLPSSKFNLLSFFHSMTKVVSGISDATHAEDGNNDGRGQMCLCFVQTILRGTDRILDVRRRSGIDAKGGVWTKNEKECIECYKGFLTKMLAEASSNERGGHIWLWNSI